MVSAVHQILAVAPVSILVSFDYKYNSGTI